MTQQERQKLVNEKRTGRGFLNNRYVMIVAIIEVFFRTNMGVRYFTFPLFFAGLCGIALIRFWMAADYFQLDRFDAFTISYVLLGLYNFYLQSQNTSKGVVIHTWYTGDSRFAFVGRFFKARYPNLFAYVYIEPLVIFLLVLPILTYSFWLAVGAIVGACQLWYQNYRLVTRFKNEEMDRQDGKAVSEYVASTSFDDPTDRSTPPPIPRRAAPPPIPLPNKEDHEELSPMEALERLSKKKQER